MNALLQALLTLVTAAVLVLAALSAHAQQAKSVDGIVVQLGLMSAERAVHAEGHRDAHPASFPSGSQHVLITLADAKSGKPIADADVVVEVVDPHGAVEKKALLHTSAAGMPDYSELFVFGWSGTYSLRMTATRPNAKPLKTTFTVHHSI
jgi:hypothetical protein